MSFIRPILVLALISVALWFTRPTAHLFEHHVNESVFQTLYLHLQPARLLASKAADGAEVEASGGVNTAPARSDYVVAFEHPSLPAFFDMDHATEGHQLIPTNLQLFQILAVLLVLVCFSGVPNYIRTGRGDVLTRVFAGFALWIRDEMVYPVMGPETGRRFLPYFLSIFFFILFMNLLGLVPGGATATANIFVTMALATITLASMVIAGMVSVGPIHFFTSQVPHVPALLWPLMFVVEIVGLLVVKPFALMVRLFANMTGGHMVVLSFMGLIFFFAQREGDMVGWATSPVAVGFAVFIMIIEAFVAMLQAYIFTQLSILFVQGCVHPEH